MSKDRPASPASRLVLGTAQFGLDYGIANDSGPPADAEVARILALARDAGVPALDTAIAYGDAEQRLGRLGVDAFRLMSKLPAVPTGCADVSGWVQAQLEGSLARLRVDRLDALSLHRPAQLLVAGGDELARALQELRADRRVGAIGASVYEVDVLPALFAAFDFDLVQAPCNVFDRRILDSGWNARLRARGCRLHLRSCFLQGLLLLPPSRRPQWCSPWAAHFARWDAWLHQRGMGALEACLRFALAVPDCEGVVLGVDSAAQLEAILALPAEPLSDLPDALACDDPDLVNPSRWPTTK